MFGRWQQAEHDRSQFAVPHLKDLFIPFKAASNTVNSKGRGRRAVDKDVPVRVVALEAWIDRDEAI
jgi:hypothetical protein